MSYYYKYEYQIPPVAYLLSTNKYTQIAVYGEYVYFSGGGGGSTGIPNQIHIYHRTITPQPTAKVSTGSVIVENMTPLEEAGILVCNGNADVLVYRVAEDGKELNLAYRFKADFSPSNATINALCLSSNGKILCTGGDDTTIRFFTLGQSQAKILHEYNAHSHPIKNVDHNQNELYLGTDNHLVTVFNLPKKQLVRQIYQDQFQPPKSLFQSAYFLTSGSQQLLFVHFIFKQATYVTREEGNKLRTIEVAQDQSCQTAFHRQNKLLGIACGNGTTLMFETKRMVGLGKEQNHKFVITGCTMTRKTNRFLTGTPECSYNIQNPTEDMLPFSPKHFITLGFTLLLILLLGSNQFAQL